MTESDILLTIVAAFPLLALYQPTFREFVMPEINTGPEAPIRERKTKKSSGGIAQALTMVTAWVGGAAAAAAAAFWILQIVRPADDPKQVETDRSVAQEIQEIKKARQDQDVKPKQKTQQRKSKPAKPKATVPVAKVDRQNFQRPSMPGLVYRYFESDSFGMPDFAKVPATRSGMLTSIANLAMAKNAKGLQLEGYWETNTEQPCEFSLISTNSARLWIDDQLILDNTSQFEPGPVKGTRTISPGMHQVRAEFLLKTQGGSFTLDVGAVGDSNRLNLDQLMRPFESDQPSSLENLQYELAKYPKPAMVTGSLFASNRKAAAASFFEAESETSGGVSETADDVLPSSALLNGRLLVGVAICADAGRVTGVKPIYLNEAGLSAGDTIGQEVGQWQSMIAKPGYAVSAIQFGQLDLAEVRSEFMQIGDKTLLPERAYSQTLAGSPVPTATDADRQPVVGLRGQMSSDSNLESIEVIRVLSARGQLLLVLTEGFPTKGLKKTPAPSVVRKELKKLSKESAGKLSGKTGSAQRTELKALASSVASAAGDSGNAESEFVALLEARRLYLLAGDIESAFALTKRMMDDFDYDQWKDVLAVFADSARRAGTSSTIQRAVIAELDPAIGRAERQYEFEVAGKLAVGGKMIAKGLKDQMRFKKYQQHLDRFEQLARVTEQARVAAKKLLVDPDDGRSNRNMGIFFLAVSEDWDEAMNHFARSSSEDYKFIGDHDRNFTAADGEVAKKLADCWVGVGKKVDALTELANKRARTILKKTRGQAQDEDLEDLESALKNL